MVNEEVLAHVKYLFEKIFRRPGPMLESNLKQAEVPDTCTVLHNKRGTAPGMWFKAPLNPPQGKASPNPSQGKASLPSKGGFSDSDKSYNPTVWVSTKKINDKVFISVKDNGPGIPKKILDKIFQPFFTTKPTGQGTGLGLSLSYDIVKAHGGELNVETKENKGSTFIISLPV